MRINLLWAAFLLFLSLSLPPSSLANLSSLTFYFFFFFFFSPSLTIFLTSSLLFLPASYYNLYLSVSPLHFHPSSLLRLMFSLSLVRSASLFPHSDSFSFCYYTHYNTSNASSCLLLSTLYPQKETIDPAVWNTFIWNNKFQISKNKKEPLCLLCFGRIIQTTYILCR